MNPAIEFADVPIRPAATVMLIRDAASATGARGAADAAGVEVFMLRRTLKAVFASGMYVFPGGRVDDVDGGAAIEAVCDGLTDEHASALLQIESGGLAFWVAAIRECFEEAGVLLARSTSTGDIVRFDDAETQARFTAERERVHDNSVDLIQLCAIEGLRLATDQIFYNAHWITPLGEPRRFDTRFFLARAPEAQEPLHDDGETIASLWVRPADALQRERDRELMMLPPTISCLRYLDRFDSADAVLADAAAVGVPKRILPKVIWGEPGERLVMKLPGEPGYDEMAG